LQSEVILYRQSLNLNTVHSSEVKLTKFQLIYIGLFSTKTRKEKLE